MPLSVEHHQDYTRSAVPAGTEKAAREEMHFLVDRQKTGEVEHADKEQSW